MESIVITNANMVDIFVLSFRISIEKLFNKMLLYISWIDLIDDNNVYSADINMISVEILNKRVSLIKVLMKIIGAKLIHGSLSFSFAVFL